MTVLTVLIRSWSFSKLFSRMTEFPPPLSGVPCMVKYLLKGSMVRQPKHSLMSALVVWPLNPSTGIWTNNLVGVHSKLSKCCLQARCKQSYPGSSHPSRRRTCVRDNPGRYVLPDCLVGRGVDSYYRSSREQGCPGWSSNQTSGYPCGPYFPPQAAFPAKTWNREQWSASIAPRGVTGGHIEGYRIYMKALS